MTSVIPGVRPRSVVSVLLACALVIACDDDPSAPANVRPILTPDVGTTIPIQGSIGISSNVALDPTSALDPENFVVINTCTGLRVPGSLELSADSTELTFTPSSALPYLTPLSIRVQNLRTGAGNAMVEPFIFSTATEAPPVTDVSWSRITSPTGDVISGVDFVSRDVGYAISVEGAAVYRTDDGGNSLSGVFRDPNIKLAKGLRAATRDEVYMIAAPNFGGTTFTTFGLFKSTDAGFTFDSVFTRNPADFRSLSMELVGTRRVLYMVGNLSSTLATFRYDATTGEVVTFSAGQPGSVIGNGGDISPDTTKALAVGVRVVSCCSPLVISGVVYRSLNSGRTFTEVTNLPAGFPRQLNGAGFINNTTALLLGDSSTVHRMDVTTGAITSLGAAAGIPQTDTLDNGVVETYSFTKAEFAPNNRQIGWVIGEVLRDDPRPGIPDVRRGVILMTRDGGLTFTRQAVAAAPDLGLGFPSLYPPSDISALANDFAVIGGYEGFIAARRADVQVTVQACSFETP